MTKEPDLPILPFATLSAWEAWLEEHHATSKGLWLKLAKAGAGVASITYAEAIEGALCFGWIDGQKGALDERFWLQRFTPRKARSKWSQINCAKVDALLAKDRLRPAGAKEVALARKDGRWDAAYAGSRTATVPPDLELALAGNARARAFFATLDSANRYAILYRVQEPKKPETRARRIEKFVAMLAAHEKIHN
jgi:uncharacterized protein YdeI (YjbR/CyaY-like superfamily)